MEKLNSEYVALLTGPGKASAKFWGLEKRILQDKDSVGVVAHMSRSSMYHDILSLLNDGVITIKELAVSAKIFVRKKYLRKRWRTACEKTENTIETGRSVPCPIRM